MSIVTAHSVDLKPRDYSYHCHNHLEMLLCVNADAEFTIESNRYKMNAYDLFIVRERRYHFLNVLSEKRYERYLISFERSDVNMPPEIIERAVSREYINVGAYKQLISLFEKTEKYKKFGQLYGNLKKNILEELIVLLSDLKDENTDALSVSSDRVIKEIINHVEQNLSSALSLDSIADRVYLSRYYLCRYFHKNMGISLMQYIQKKRVLNAQNLIKQGVPPIKASMLSGFNDYTNFYKAYKKHLGISPREDLRQ